MFYGGSKTGDSRGPGGTAGAGGPGSRGGGTGVGNRNDRFEQMTKQQQLIEQKKREIEAKLEAERQKRAMELLLGSTQPPLPPPPPPIPITSSLSSGPVIGSPSLGSSPTSSTKSPGAGESAQDTVDTKPKLIFSNDGSFFEQFKRLQEQQKKEKEALIVPKVEPEDETDEYGNPLDRKPLIKVMGSAPVPGQNIKSSAAIPPPSFYDDPYAPPPPPPIPPPNNHKNVDYDYDYPPQSQSVYSHSHNQMGLMGNYHDVLPPPPPPPGPYPQKSSSPGFPSQPVKDLAAEVAHKGDPYEETMNNNNNPLFWFLNRPDSEEYRRYRDLVFKLRAELPVKVNNISPNPTPVPPPALKRQNSDESEESAKKRRSRWGPQSSQLPSPAVVALPPPGVAIPQVQGMVPGIPLVSPMIQAPLPGSSRPGPPPALTKVTRTNPQLLAYARQAYGTINLDEEQWKQCEEAYKMNLLFQDIARKKAKDEKLALAGKHKHEYDSDEEVDDLGTWEHKKRLQEMEKTRDWASELTQKAQGKHHIGDFLPPEELAKFMDKYKAVKEGKTMTESAYQDFKIAQDNVGFKLLQKMGWSDGQGLGATGQGISAPIDSGNTSVDNAGLGLENPSEVKGDDDEYSAYRKRMMLAYRFRPNPLNNPRRAYY